MLKARFLEHILWRFFSTRIGRRAWHDDPFWEFINELKYPQKKEEREENSEPVDEREDKKRKNEEEDKKNEDRESAYDGNNDED